MNSNVPERQKLVHTHRTSFRRDWPRGFDALNSSRHSWIFTSVLVRFQSSLLLIHFRYGLNTRSYYTKEWHRTYPICYSPLSLSVRRSFATWQKSRCHNRSGVWKDALSDMIFVTARKLSAIVWTQAKTPGIQIILSLAPSGLREEDGLKNTHWCLSTGFPNLVYVW